MRFTATIKQLTKRVDALREHYRAEELRLFEHATHEELDWMCRLFQQYPAPHPDTTRWGDWSHLPFAERRQLDELWGRLRRRRLQELAAIAKARAADAAK